MFFRTKTFFLAQFLLSFLGLGLLHTLYASENDILEISDVLTHQTEVNRVLLVPVPDSLSVLDQEDFLTLNLDTVVVTSSDSTPKKISSLDSEDQEFPILSGENRLRGFNFDILFFFLSESSQNFIYPITILAKNSVLILEKADIFIILDARQSFDSKNCTVVFLFQKNPFDLKLFGNLLYSIVLEKNTTSWFHIIQDQGFFTHSYLNIAKVERLKFLPKFKEELTVADWKQKNESFALWQTWGRVCNFIDRLPWKLRSDEIVLAKEFQSKSLTTKIEIPLSVSTNDESIRFQNLFFQFDNFFYQNPVVG
ncbi:hypothetical protein MAL08_19395 [Leptospira noguchii]|uniref:hypothetical protein n=1 Tax=Leptospira noguchii TaxID=28182 RepID=UPI001FB5BC3B|nr:hypothetical protein [Leptospira noguchii]UOG39765.1 hypothetical protein MAL08_19395 [Leptospira noguchii]